MTRKWTHRNTHGPEFYSETDSWPSPDDADSYWIFLIMSDGHKDDSTLLNELLMFSEFDAKESAMVRCISSSNNTVFNQYVKRFGVKRLPALIVSPCPNMKPREVLQGQSLERALVDYRGMRKLVMLIHQDVSERKNLNAVKRMKKKIVLWNTLDKIGGIFRTARSVKDFYRS